MNDHLAVLGISKPLSRIVFGTAHLPVNEQNVEFDLLDRFVELGGNTIETAHQYGYGDSERAIGRWIKSRNCRDQVVVISKGGHPWADRSRITRDCIDADLEESLNRLQTNYIDVYLLHRDDPAKTVAELMDLMNRHLQAGRVRAIGASNWSFDRMLEANRYARQSGLVPLAVASPHFSLAKMESSPWGSCVAVSKSELTQYAENELTVLAWSSQARGFFTGRYAKDNTAQDDAVRSWFSDPNFEKLRRAQIIAESKGVSAMAVAVAYVLAQKELVLAAIGPMTKDELDDSMSAARVDLTREELDFLDLTPCP